MFLQPSFSIQYFLISGWYLSLLFRASVKSCPLQRNPTVQVQPLSKRTLEKCCIRKYKYSPDVFFFGCFLCIFAQKRFAAFTRDLKWKDFVGTLRDENKIVSSHGKKTHQQHTLKSCSYIRHSGHFNVLFISSSV